MEKHVGLKLADVVMRFIVPQDFHHADPELAVAVGFERCHGWKG
jgi:hypothetical protein